MNQQEYNFYKLEQRVSQLESYRGGAPMGCLIILATILFWVTTGSEIRNWRERVDVMLEAYESQKSEKSENSIPASK